jgi:AraC-like DNA-binding protein/mannose-6-phosphate isomerase-like protein (cupin superfamily)
MAIILDKHHYFEPNGFPISVWKEGLNITAPNRPNYTETEHSHNFWEIVLINGGSGKHNLEGQSFPVGAGDVFLIQKHQKHFFHDLNELELVNVLYDPELLGFPEKELRKLPGYCAMFMLEPQHRKQHKFSSRLHLKRRELAPPLQIIEKIESACNEKDAGWEITALTSLQELIIYLSKSYVLADSPDATSLLRVADVIALLEKDYLTQWTLDDLVRTANMSKGNLIRIFKNATNQTPIEYLVDIRIQHAIDLLLNTDITITEIAYQVGFNDGNYFSRHFKKKLKLSPRDYRLNNRRKNGLI